MIASCRLLLSPEIRNVNHNHGGKPQLARARPGIIQPGIFHFQRELPKLRIAPVTDQSARRRSPVGREQSAWAGAWAEQLKTVTDTDRSQSQSRLRTHSRTDRGALRVRMAADEPNVTNLLSAYSPNRAPDRLSWPRAGRQASQMVTTQRLATHPLCAES